jgi:hypothetical protein
VAWVLEHAAQLREGHTYRAEAMFRPKHNTLCYERAPVAGFVLFDVATTTEGYARSDVVQQAARLGVEVVPELWCGALPSGAERLALLDELLNTASILGGPIEGVVIKARTLFGLDGKPLLAKYVSEQFKERHGQDWKKRNPGHNDVIQKLIDEHRTEARWAKARQRLAETDSLEGSPRDIGALCKATVLDLGEEAQEEIKEALWQWAWPKIRRAAVKGLPEWYKRRLAEGGP